MSAPIVFTAKTRSVPGTVGVVGPADVLEAAFQAGDLVTLEGKLAGERVHLGHRRQIHGDNGITLERVGLDHRVGDHPKYPGVEIAVYLIDTKRLEHAPRLADLVRQADARRTAHAVAVTERVAAEDERLENLAEDDPGSAASPPPASPPPRSQS